VWLSPWLSANWRFKAAWYRAIALNGPETADIELIHGKFIGNPTFFINPLSEHFIIPLQE
jgi:hypothetical protein